MERHGQKPSAGISSGPRARSSRWTPSRSTSRTVPSFSSPMASPERKAATSSSASLAHVEVRQDRAQGGGDRWRDRADQFRSAYLWKKIWPGSGAEVAGSAGW